MIAIRRVLLATDFSACSQGAVRHALALSRALSADVVILHVIELPAGMSLKVAIHPDHPDDGSSPALSVEEYVGGAARRALRELVELFQEAGVKATPLIEFGGVADMICEKAVEVGAGLVVVGTHGRSGLRRMILGSIAERLVRTCRVPVLTVRHEGEDSLPEEEEQARIEAEG
jgi:nucleotide-binding universal stress UspA family protein